MLKFWRKRSKTFVVHLVFWPIILVFVIWGFERYGNPVGGAAAVVNNRTITISEYRNALQRMVEFYTQMLQGNFDEEAQNRYHVKEAALRQLISTELVAEEAEAMGMQVTDNEVRNAITDIPAFKKDGKFSRENYDYLLRSNHLTPTQFEADLRKNALIDKARRLFEKNLPPSLGEIEKEKVLRAKKVNIEFCRIDREALADKASIGDNQLKEFLKDPTHEKQIKEYFDLRKSEFSKPEEIHVRHILVKAKKGNQAEETAALEKVKRIQKEIKTSSFEGLAKKYSDDPGSKKKGGDLGWFSQGRMVPDFEKVAFALKPDEVSSPVQTPFGFHLIKLEGRHPAQTTSLDEARAGIAKKMIGREKADAELKEIEALASTDPKGASKAVEKLGPWKWEETGFFSLADEQIPKIGESEEIASAAFALSKDKPMAPKLFRVSGTGYLIRLKANQESSDSSEKWAADAARETSRNVFTAWSSKLFEKAKINTNKQLFSQSGESPSDDPGF